MPRCMRGLTWGCTRLGIPLRQDMQRAASANAPHCIGQRSAPHPTTQRTAFPGGARLTLKRGPDAGTRTTRNAFAQGQGDMIAETEMTKRFVLAGSFDPFTIGHADVAQRALALCDELVIGIGYNEHKTGWIPVEERLRAMRELYAHEPRVRVEKYSCLTVDFAQQTGACCIVRGVRGGWHRDAAAACQTRTGACEQQPGARTGSLWQGHTAPAARRATLYNIIRRRRDEETTQYHTGLQHGHGHSGTGALPEPSA